MLTIAKEHITAGETRDGETRGEAVNPDADVRLFGQEVNPETFAVCKSDLFMKSEDGRDARRVLFGSTLSNDRHAGDDFDYMIANPPCGKDWKRDQDAVRAEHDRGAAGRFGPGLPRISDGQLLFLQHVLAHVKEPAQGGSRVAIIMNGSPLFTGDAGSGESEIRRWILENDLLEALIALPEQLDGERAFANLAVSRKRGEAKARDEEAGRKQQAGIRALLRRLPDKLVLDRAVFEADLSRAAQEASHKLAAPIRTAILSALSEPNAEAAVCRDREGRPEPDPELRDTENVPLRETVEAFFEREVKPHVPDAWIDTTRRDPQDGEVGIVGYEINFNRYFYEYRPPRPLEEIEADIQQVEKEIVAMLREMTG